MKAPRHFPLFALLPLFVGCSLGAAEKFEPKDIISNSLSFQKEREPSVTGEEYALYERVVSVLNSQPDLALRILDGVFAGKEKPSPAFEFLLGNAFFTLGKNEEAVAHYRLAVERYPNFVRAWLNLGTVLYSSQKYKEATPCLLRVLSLGERGASTYGMLAYCHEKAGDLVQAEMVYEQAFNLDPLCNEWLEGLMRVCVKNKNLGRAEMLAAELVRRKPNEQRHWQSHARILLQQERKLDAMAVLEACAAFGVARVEEYGMLADLYLELGLMPEAAETLKKLGADNKVLGERRLLDFASTCIASGDLKQAESLLEEMRDKALSGNPGPWLLTKAELLSAKKEWSKAKELLGQLLTAEPMNGGALISLGRVQLAEGDAARASLSFEAAQQIPASAFQANLQLANLELRERHYDKAVALLEKALKIEKNAVVENYLAQVKSMIEQPKRENP